MSRAIQFEAVELDECKRVLLHKLYRETSTEIRDKLIDLSREKISQIVAEQN